MTAAGWWRRLTSLPGVRGVLEATADGRALDGELAGCDPRAAAAMVASTLAMGERLAELAGAAPVEQLLVRTRSGAVLLRPAGAGTVVAVVCDAAANLGRLELELRRAPDRGAAPGCAGADRRFESR